MSGPRAGWYADPDGEGERHWNGSNWTEQRRPQSVPAEESREHASPQPEDHLGVTLKSLEGSPLAGQPTHSPATAPPPENEAPLKQQSQLHNSSSRSGRKSRKPLLVGGALSAIGAIVFGAVLVGVLDGEDAGPISSLESEPSPEERVVESREILHEAYIRAQSETSFNQGSYSTVTPELLKSSLAGEGFSVEVRALPNVPAGIEAPPTDSTQFPFLVEYLDKTLEEGILYIVGSHAGNGILLSYNPPGEVETISYFDSLGQTGWLVNPDDRALLATAQ